MPDKKKRLLILHRLNDVLLSGVGAGTGHAFVAEYFPVARQTLRIASAYFSLKGFEHGRQYVNEPHVQYCILVRNKEGVNVQDAAVHVVDRMLKDLGQNKIPLADAVKQLVEKMQRNEFLIRDAREMKPLFHCKFFVCDEKVMWQGSANYSRPGLLTQAEQASAIHDPAQINNFIDWFDRTIADAIDLLPLLRGRLEKWLELADPFDVYLKTLFLLNYLTDKPPLPYAHEPAYYQKGVVAQALRQINNYGGSFVVAATGLGKTVIGAEIAGRLLNSGTTHFILIAPSCVHESWQDQCQGRHVTCHSFSINILFQQSSKSSHHQIYQLEKQLKRAADHTLIIIDEAHFYRKELFKERSHNKASLVYQRLLPAVENGAKILLLTATPYGTNLLDLDGQLRLLPHRSRNLLGAVAAWESPNANEFAALPVVTILGLPHVIKMAQNREDFDENGRTFIRFAGDRKMYLPETLKLEPIKYDLFEAADLLAAFDADCFSQEKKKMQPFVPENTKNIVRAPVDTTYNAALTSWLGSPAALSENIKSNLATADAEQAENAAGENVALKIQIAFDFAQNKTSNRQRQTAGSQPAKKGFNSNFCLSLSEREPLLLQLLERLEKMTASDDDKLNKLVNVIERKCLNARRKALVFVERHRTACYIAEQLQKRFEKSLRIGCTVELGGGKPQLKSAAGRKTDRRRISPRSHNLDGGEDEYDVLICTDADGVGVNMQDADTIVNYDPPESADVLFQRAGRVLRMTAEPNRVLSVYTFVPSVVFDSFASSRAAKNISEIFNRLTGRHDRSKQILGAGVLAPKESTEIKLDGEYNIEQLLSGGILFDQFAWLGENSGAQHLITLDDNRRRAAALPIYLFSARRYRGREPRMFVLLKHDGKYHPTIFDVRSEQLEPMDEPRILDYIACANDEPKVWVEPSIPENLAIKTAKLWCRREGVPLGKVEKVCGMLLAPISEPDTIWKLFGDVAEKAKYKGKRAAKK